MPFRQQGGFTAHWVHAGFACPEVLLWVTDYVFSFGDLTLPTQSTFLIPPHLHPLTPRLQKWGPPSGLACQSMHLFGHRDGPSDRRMTKLYRLESMPGLLLRILKKSLALCPRIFKVWTVSPDQLVVFFPPARGEAACLRMKLTERKVGSEHQFPDNKIWALGSNFA